MTVSQLKAKNHVKRILLAALMLVVSLGVGFSTTEAQGNNKTLVIKVADQEPEDVIEQLEEEGLVPSGGKLLWRSPAKKYAWVHARKDDFTDLSVARGAVMQDFVMQFYMLGILEGEESGCGMFFRKSGKGYGNSSLVLLTMDRKLSLAQLEDNEFVVQFSESIDDLEGIGGSNFAKNYELEDQVHIVTVTAIRDEINFFLDGVHITTQTGERTQGYVSMALFNEKGVNEVNECRYADIWLWQYR